MNSLSMELSQATLMNFVHPLILQIFRKGLLATVRLRDGFDVFRIVHLRKDYNLY